MKRYSNQASTLCGVLLLVFCTSCQQDARSPDITAREREANSELTPLTILNVSYDPTREFYADINAAFSKKWKADTGQGVNFEQSHGGSGKQARAVLDGLGADVVTLALAHDIDMLAKKGLIQSDWRERLPNKSAPYTSTIVFLVRPGNPKQIHDWDDLVRDGIELVAANPKTGGGARWNYLAAWGFSLKKSLGDLKRLKDGASAADIEAAQLKAKDFVGKLYSQVVVLDSGARGATTSFLQRGIGDALICWENEAHLALNELGYASAELIVPSSSILAEPPVAVVDRNVDQHGTRAVATAYLQFLYTPDGQRIAAERYYRPYQTDAVPAKLLERFPAVDLFTIDDVFGGWDRAQENHFIDGATFDQIYQPKK